MRALVTRDLFSMMRIVSKANIKDELRKAVENNADATNRGIDIILAVMGGISDKQVEKELYVFLADVLECAVEDISESDPFVLIDRLTKDEGSKQWSDFFMKLFNMISLKR